MLRTVWSFHVFPCIKSLNMTSDEFATKLLMEERLLLFPERHLENAAEGYVRISYAYSIDNLKIACG